MEGLLGRLDLHLLPREHQAWRPTLPQLPELAVAVGGGQRQSETRADVGCGRAAGAGWTCRGLGAGRSRPFRG